MSRSRMRGGVRHNRFCDDTELYFANKSRYFDYPVRVHGRTVGHLLPGNIENPSGENCIRGGMDMGDLVYGGGPPCMGSYPCQGNYPCQGFNISSGFSPRGDFGGFGGCCRGPSVYDPRIACTPFYCPGTGLRIPCCANMYATVNNTFRLRSWPRGLCEDVY